MTDQPEKFSDDPRQNLHIENQILKLKMQVETGAFFVNDSHELPPEVENDFLRQVQMFENAWQHMKQKSVYDLLNRPQFKKESTLENDCVVIELERILEIMEAHRIHLDILANYDPRVIYRFITEELFPHMTDDLQLPGWITNFIYEEFHPNHRMDIQNRATEFMSNWLQQRFDLHSWELGEQFLLKEGNTITKPEVLRRLDRIFDSFNIFRNGEYDISEIEFDWDEKDNKGLGHAEGSISYDAEMENGEILKFDGSFKLYMSNEAGWWSIFYFEFPGFNW